MMVDMSNVAWLSKVQISQETVDLLEQWAIFTGQEVRPPIPVEAIAERYLEFTVEYDNLDEILGIRDVLGATWAEGREWSLTTPFWMEWKAELLLPAAMKLAIGFSIEDTFLTNLCILMNPVTVTNLTLCAGYPLLN